MGDEGFIEKIKMKYCGIKNHKEIPQSKYLEYLEPRIEDIRVIVSKMYKVTEESLLKSQRSFYNEARDAAIYITRLNTGKKREEIGVGFDIENYSTVSSIIVKMRDRRKVDKGLAKRLLQIDQTIKGQRQT